MRSIKLAHFRRRFVAVPIYRPVYGLRRAQLQGLGIWTGDVAYDIVGHRKYVFLEYVGHRKRGDGRHLMNGDI